MFNESQHPRVKSGPTAGEWTSGDASTAIQAAASDKNITKSKMEDLKLLNEAKLYADDNTKKQIENVIEIYDSETVKIKNGYGTEADRVSYVDSLWRKSAINFSRKTITNDLGGVKIHTSSSGSEYYKLPDKTTIRLSNHKLDPAGERAKRNFSGKVGKWDVNFVIDHRRGSFNEPKKMSELKQNLLDAIDNSKE